MALAKGYAANLETIIRAAKAGDLALMECLEIATGETRAVLCAISRDDGEFTFAPFGHLCPGNPYELYAPPNPDAPDGFIIPEKKKKNKH